VRLQLALNVANIDTAVQFYATLFGVEPHKRRPGYANFEIAAPPLKLVLFEQAELGERLNHLGVEVESTDEVSAAIGRLAAAGLATEVEESTECCFAVQDKVWVTEPDGARWEVYTVLDDDPDGLGASAPVALSVAPGAASGGVCCS